MKMAPPDLGDPASLPQSPFALSDTFPLANTNTTTDSGESFISQVPGDFSSSSYSHLTQLPHQAVTQVQPMTHHNLPVGAQVLEQHEVAFLPDGRVVVLPQGRENQGPVCLPHVPTYAAQLSSQQSMYELQNMLQSRNRMHSQTDLQYQRQAPDSSAAYQQRYMAPFQPFQDFSVETETTNQLGSRNNSPPGFGRGSVPLFQRSTSVGSAPEYGDGYQGYGNLRQNAQRVAHPNDGLRGRGGRGGRGRRDFHSWANTRGQRMQNYIAQDLGGRHASAGNETQAQSLAMSFTSTTGGDIQQTFPQAVSSNPTFTPNFNRGEPSADNQQQSSVHDQKARVNKQQTPAVPVSVGDTNGRRAFEEGLIQATLALQLENAGTPQGNGMDDITPRRPIADNTVSATAPPKLGHQTPMLRSRRGQSTVGLNGSPVRRISQPLTIDPIRGPPPAFYPQYTPHVVSTPTVPSTVPSVSVVQHQSEASDSRDTSVSALSEEPHTAQGMIFGSDQLVTPNNTQIVRTQTAQVALPSTQTTPYSMARNQIVPWSLAPYQPSTPVSRHLSIIAPGGKKPSIEVACDPQNLPFVELMQRAHPSNGNGVVRISNIPYSTTRAEIVAFLGRNAEIIEDKFEPVHIIMDRVSGKTMDAYIEFKDVHQAVRAVDRQIEVHRDGNKGGRLGNRFVTVEVSGLESMMRALFPKATNVVWHGAVPEIMPLDPTDRYSTGFKGFINPEELVLLVKHVQDPNRIHFSEKCPQRPFECMISTIIKYPWYMGDYVTIGDRDEIFQAALAIVKGLLNRMSEDDLFLNSRLLKRMSQAIFNCPGFTESQKDDVAFTCNINPYTMNPPLAPMADHWYVFKAIGPKPGVQEDVLKYYIALLREATTSMDMVTLAQRGNTSGSDLPSFFGNINIQYPPDVKFWTFSQVARIEWGVIDNLLRQSLSRRE